MFTSSRHVVICGVVMCSVSYSDSSRSLVLSHADTRTMSLEDVWSGDPKSIRLPLNGTNSGLFSDQIFSTFWLTELTILAHLKRSRICLIWSQTWHPCVWLQFKCWMTSHDEWRHKMNDVTVRRVVSVHTNSVLCSRPVSVCCCLLKRCFCL